MSVRSSAALMGIEVRLPGRSSFNEVRDLGAVIKRTNGGGNHVGFLYKLDGEAPGVCHLAWHYDLRTGAPDDSYAWVQSGLDEANRTFIALALADLAEHGTVAIPYSTTYEGDYFEPGTLSYVRGEPGDGLTCATFVLAVFRAFGFELLDEGGWPARDSDDAWRRSVINLLEVHGGGHPDLRRHIEELSSSTRGVRYRPEEVAAGVGCNHIPMTYESIIPLRDQVLVALAGKGASVS